VTHGLRGRVSGFAHSFQRRLSIRTRRLLTASSEAARLLVEIILLSASSARDYLRSMVLLRRLHVRRAAVIYSTGCAALGGQDRRFEHARAELRLLDELIAAASRRTTFGFMPDESAATAPADVPTEESALMPPATNAVPALRQGHWSHPRRAVRQTRPS
jgi:hypothetical protein